MSTATDIALKAYALGWKAALPLLRRNSRLRDGWEQRTLTGGMPGPADLWIQAASGGEAYLAWEVLRNLTPPPSGSLRVLATTNTLQGHQILARAAGEAEREGLAIQPWYFPFDSPNLMQRMVGHVRPKAALILETEIWPGFLGALKKSGTGILLANGRMSPKSLAGYLTWPGLFRAMAPDCIMAVSPADAARFATLFGQGKIQVMHNIKFDRMGDTGLLPREKNPLSTLLPGNARFAVFGSVRKEEEPAIRRLTAGLMDKRPKTILGLFPRHMHHLALWQQSLDKAGVNWVLRSELTDATRPGTVILWDTFGELTPAYGLARAAFVGGSLAPLGGQNFLEPLTCGVTPVIGPHWKNFAWVGREAVDSKMVVEATGINDALESLINLLDNPAPRQRVAAQARNYIKDRRGGAKTVCKRLADFLNKD